MYTDPVADLLTRIRNAVRVERPFVDIPMSKLKSAVADVLKREGFIWDWQEVVLGESPDEKVLRVALKYGANGERVIQCIRRVSKPGRRVYLKSTTMKSVLGGMGILVLSTSRGVVSDREAKRQGIGGEVLCEVY